MRKIPTVFVRDPDDLSRVTREVHPDCGWVFAGEGVATRKYDGTCVLLDPGTQEWWARREVTPGKTPPPGFRPVMTDDATGKTVGWEPADQSPFAKFLREAIEQDPPYPRGGTFELIGPKINGNPEASPWHILVRHEHAQRYEPLDHPDGYDYVMGAVLGLGWEGVVWHHPDGRMAKVKARDFGVKR